MINVITFSGRKSDGNCSKIAKFISKNINNLYVKHINFCDNDIHNCSKCNYECIKNDSICVYKDSMETIFKDLSIGELNIFIIPTYCDFPSSNLFIFNERTQGSKILQTSIDFNNNLIIILLTNTNHDVIIDILTTMFNIDINKILLLSTNDYELKGIEGNIIENSHVKSRILSFVFSYISIQKYK